MTCTFEWRLCTSRTALTMSGPSRVELAHPSLGLLREATYLGSWLNSIAISASTPFSWYGQKAAKMS